MILRPPQWRLFLHLVSLFTLLACVFAVSTSLKILDKPFPGFLLESSMLVSTQRFADWSGTAAGITAYDRLLMANGVPLESPANLERLVQSLPVGSPITYRLARKDALLTVTAPTQTFHLADYAGICVPYFLSAATFLLIGLVVFWLRPDHPAAQAHLLFSSAFSLFLSQLIVFITTHQFAGAYVCMVYLLGSTGLHLFLVFPQPSKWLARTPWLHLIPYGLPLPVVIPLFFLFRPLGFSAPPHMVDLHFAQLTIWSVWMTLTILFIIGRCLYFVRRGPSMQIRGQAGVVLLGAIVSFLPSFLVYLVPQLLGQVGSVPPWMQLLEILGFHLFPLSIAYAIIRHQLFDIRLVVRRATLYAALIAGLALLYVVVAGIGYAILGRFFPIHSGPSLPGFVAALGVAVAFRPFHDHLRRGIDRLFLGKRASALQVLTRFSRRALPDEPTLAQELLEVVEQALRPRWICLILADQTRYVFGEPPGYMSQVALPAAGTQMLSLRALAPEAEDQSVALILEVSNDRRHGLFIGPSAGDMPYNSDEFAMLRALMGQAAIAFQNVHLVEDRIRLTVQEGLARTAATERKHLLMQIVHDITSDLVIISRALHLARRQPDHPDALPSIRQSLERIDTLLSEKVRVVKEDGLSTTLPSRQATGDGR